MSIITARKKVARHHLGNIFKLDSSFGLTKDVNLSGNNLNIWQAVPVAIFVRVMMNFRPRRKRI